MSFSRELVDLIEDYRRLYEVIGKVAANWAAFEHLVNSSLWALAKVEHLARVQNFPFFRIWFDIPARVQGIAVLTRSLANGYQTLSFVPTAACR